MVRYKYGNSPTPFPTILDDVYTVFWLSKFVHSEIIQEQNNSSMKKMLSKKKIEDLKNII